MATDDERIKFLEKGVCGLQDQLQKLVVGMTERLQRLEESLKVIFGVVLSSNMAFSPTSTTSSDSVFADIVRAPEDPLLGVRVASNKDQSLIQLNLGVGAYRIEEGKPLVLDVVRRVEQLIVIDRFRVKEYLPIIGLADFNKLRAKFIFGVDSPTIQENKVATVQCLSSPGSPRVGGEFLARHYDPSTCGLDFKGLLEDLTSAPSGTIVLLHACAHNPTDVDPTIEQWEQIRQLMRSRGLLPFFDSAYQGFASGNLHADAKPIHMFVADGGECFAPQSYATNMGLHGERVGALSIICRSADVASKAESQLKLVVRPMYSDPTRGAPTEYPTTLYLHHVAIELTSKLRRNNGVMVCVGGNFLTSLNKTDIALGVEIILNSATQSIGNDVSKYGTERPAPKPPDSYKPQSKHAEELPRFKHFLIQNLEDKVLLAGK